MKRIIPRVAAIQDISGFGRCSLTVIIPVLSAMGVQVCPLPTAVLSTHSGGFGEFVFRDLTDDMESYAAHWKSLGLEFDCLYSGFLGSEKQIDIVAGVFDRFESKHDQIVVVDPVMGDSGKLYKTYTKRMQKKIRLLVEKADIVTPNLTEAYFLLGKSYTDKALSNSEIKSMLRELAEMGPETVVITSITTEEGRFANVGYNSESNVYWLITYEYIPVHYPGTGDIFTSVLIGGLLKGDSIPVSMDRATQFVSLVVKETYSIGTPEREGVLLEKVLGWLGNNLTHYTYSILE